MLSLAKHLAANDRGHPSEKQRRRGPRTRQDRSSDGFANLILWRHVRPEAVESTCEATSDIAARKPAEPAISTATLWRWRVGKGAYAGGLLWRASLAWNEGGCVRRGDRRHSSTDGKTRPGWSYARYRTSRRVLIPAPASHVRSRAAIGPRPPHER